jgi:hypothetical protein
MVHPITFRELTPEQVSLRLFIEILSISWVINHRLNMEEGCGRDSIYLQEPDKTTKNISRNTRFVVEIGSQDLPETK